GAGPPREESQSRAIRIAVNTKTKSATLVKQYFHSPALSSNYEGGAQLLPGGDLFVDWGQQPYFSELNGSGQTNFDAHWNTSTRLTRGRPPPPHVLRNRGEAGRRSWTATGRRPDTTRTPRAGRSSRSSPGARR